LEHSDEENKEATKWKAANDGVQHKKQNSWTTIQKDNATLNRMFLYTDIENLENKLRENQHTYRMNITNKCCMERTSEAMCMKQDENVQEPAYNDNEDM
jgi:hypothetical protein